MIGIRDAARPDCACNHGAHAGVQAHARHHNCAEIRLRGSKPSDGMEADSTRPNEVGDLVYNSEEAFCDLGPAKIPDMVAYIALREVASG